MENKLNAAVYFVMKAFAFAIIFWATWVYLMSPITSPRASSDQNAQSQSSSGGSDALMRKYWEQVKLADSLQAEYLKQVAIANEQQKRMDAVLVKQEEQGRRLDNVLSNWEKTASLKK